MKTIQKLLANEYIPLILLVLIAVITHFTWFLDFSILSYGDWGFFFQETQQELMKFGEVWNNNSFGKVFFSLPMFPVYFIFGYLAKFFPFSVSERLVYAWPSILFALVGSYYLGKYITKSRLGGFVASVVFTFNTYFIILRAGHLTLAVSFAIAPLLLYFYIRAFKESNVLFSFISAILLTLSSYYEFRAFYIVFWSLAFLAFFLFLDKFHTTKGKLLSKNNLKSLLLSIVPFGIVIIMNFFWIVPIFFTNTISSSGTFTNNLFGNSFMSISSAMTLFHPFWTYSIPSFFTKQPVFVFMWIIPITAFLGWMLNRKNRLLLYFAFISILGIILVKQANMPFPGFYHWMFNNFPGFYAYRESSKFYYFIALGYSVLLASFSVWISQKFKKGIRRRISNVLVGVIVFIFLINTVPILTQEIGTLYVPKEIPQDYLQFKDKLSLDEDYFNILWVPMDSRWGFYSSEKSKSNMRDVIKNYNYIDTSKLNILPVKERFLALMVHDQFDSFLDSTSTRYLVVAIEDVENNDNFYDIYGKRLDYVNTIGSLDFLDRVDFGTKELVVYENRDYSPIISLLDRENNNSESKFQKISNSQYRISIQNFSNNFDVFFSQGFNEGWELIGNNDKKLEEFYTHSKTQAGVNHFSLSLDSSFEDEYIDLVFKPREDIYSGLFIALVALVIFIILITLGLIYCGNEKNN